MSSYQKESSGKENITKEQNNRAQTAQLKDNRTASLKEKNTQKTLDNSSKVIQQKEKAVAISNAPVQRIENKTGLPDQLKSGIESLSGLDMSETRVHYNSSEPAQLQAHAFAQGNNIHIAPGQEQHLPHEAWHVVQQKQGRVKTTKQLKGKTAINDDAGLEREADIMGAKAMQLKSVSKEKTLKSAPVSTTIKGPVQRYTAKKDKNSESIYNVSGTEKFVIGLGYPNHELYVKDPQVLNGLNERVSEGFIKFVASEEPKNFKFVDSNVGYYKVSPSFNLDDKKKVEESAPDDDETTENRLFKGIKKGNVDNIRLPEDSETSDDEVVTKYTTNVDTAKKMYKLRMLAEATRKSIVQMDYQDHDIDDLKAGYIPLFFRIVEYVKEQSVNDYMQRYQLSTQGGDEVRGKAEDSPEINAIMATKEKTKKSDINEELARFRELIPGESDKVLMEIVKNNIDQITALLTDLPNDGSKRQFMIGHFNEQMKAVRDKEMMLIRGCDYAASTTIGKTHGSDLQGSFSMLFQLKNQSKEHHHYSTKLLADGSDFVSIEGFAGGFQTFDNAWEFFLHGGEDIETEAFENYTTSRYDFFPDTKRELADMRGDDNDGFKVTTTKEMEMDNIDKTVRSFNKALHDGGARGYKVSTRQQDERAHYNHIKGELFAAARGAIENIPGNFHKIKDNGFEDFKERSYMAVFNILNSGRDAVLTTFQQQFGLLMNTNLRRHQNYLVTIARSKNYLSNAYQSNKNFDENVTALKAACDSHIASDVNGLRKKYARDKKTSITNLKNKVDELQAYFENHFGDLDDII